MRRLYFPAATKCAFCGAEVELLTEDESYECCRCGLSYTDIFTASSDCEEEEHFVQARPREALVRVPANHRRGRADGVFPFRLGKADVESILE